MKGRLRALERRLAALGADAEPVFFIVGLAGHDTPPKCIVALKQGALQERPGRQMYLIFTTDSDGRCRACGQTH